MTARIKNLESRGMAALRTHLRPLQQWIDEPGITEISVQEPHRVWIARQGAAHMECHDAPHLSYEILLELAHQVATSTDQEISHESPLLSASLPNGYRSQFVLPPATTRGHVVLSIRKPSVLNLSLDDYEERGAFRITNLVTPAQEAIEKALLESYRARDFVRFLRLAVQARKNILISAGTDTGKTTLLNALLKEISIHERLAIIEDSPELLPIQDNVVRLFYSRGGQGLAKVTAQDLLECCLRLKPDRILLGELRGTEAFIYLRTINSGHPGSITTIHANSPTEAFEQLALMVMQGYSNMGKNHVIDYVKTLLPVVIQAQRIDGERLISEIHYAPANSI